MSKLIFKDILAGPASFILLGSFGLCLLLTLRRGEDALQAVEKLCLAFLILLFYDDGLKILFSLSNDLNLYLEKLGGNSLREFILQEIKQRNVSQDAHAVHGSLNDALNQIGEYLRYGIWGVFSSIADLIFLIASFILKVAKDALIQILYFLFPLGAALIPVYPKIFVALTTFAFEVALWFPILTIIDKATSIVARQYVTTTDTGLLIIACEVIAVILTFSIPMITHRLVSGSIGSDIFGSWTKPLSMSTLLAGRALGVAGKMKRIGGVILLFAMPMSAQASQPIDLYYGFVSKVECRGKLLLSSVGNPDLIELAPFPTSLGCGVLLKPKESAGLTNIVLETSTGTIERFVRVVNGNPSLRKNLRIDLRKGEM